MCIQTYANLSLQLDDKSKKCVFLGVSEESKAWRLYDPVTKKIVVSRDVVFDEEKYWDWDQADAGVKEVTLECEDEEERQNVEEIAETIPDVDGPANLQPPNNDTGVVAGKSVRERRAPGWMADYDT